SIIGDPEWHEGFSLFGDESSPIFGDYNLWQAVPRKFRASGNSGPRENHHPDQPDNESLENLRSIWDRGISPALSQLARVFSTLPDPVLQADRHADRNWSRHLSYA